MIVFNIVKLVLLMLKTLFCPFSNFGTYKIILELIKNVFAHVPDMFTKKNFKMLSLFGNGQCLWSLTLPVSFKPKVDINNCALLASPTALDVNWKQTCM